MSLKTNNNNKAQTQLLSDQQILKNAYDSNSQDEIGPSKQGNSKCSSHPDSLDSPQLNKKVKTPEQIKALILLQLPEMKNQIDSLDVQTLAEIYSSLDNQKEDKQRIVNPNPSITNPSIPNQNQKQVKSSNINEIKRSKAIQSIIDQLIENVPHLKNQILQFSDQQIKQLYSQIMPNAPILKQTPEPKGINDKRKGYQISKAQARQYLYRTVPQMQSQLKLLSDDDIMEVYEQQMKDAALQMKNSVPYKNKNQMKQDNIGYYKPSAQQKYPGFGGGKHSQNSGTVRNYPRSSIYDKMSTSPSNGNYYGDYPNPYRGSATNSGIVAHNLDPNDGTTPRTMILFHTEDLSKKNQKPKFKCGCSCCERHQMEKNNPNYYTQFLNELFKKYMPN